VAERAPFQLRYREARRLSGPSRLVRRLCGDRRCYRAAFTVSVAALLVAVPALLVTTTRTSSRLSEVVVAGVV